MENNIKQVSKHHKYIQIDKEFNTYFHFNDTYDISRLCQCIFESASVKNERQILKIYSQLKVTYMEINFHNYSNQKKVKKNIIWGLRIFIIGTEKTNSGDECELKLR